MTGYRVEQSADGGSDWSTVVADTGSTSTNYTVTGLANGSMYAFRVAAVNVAGTGGTSSTASETPRTTPGRPIGVVSEDGDAQSALTWTAPTSAGGAAVTGYLVEQSSDGGTTWSTVVADTGSTSTAYTVTSLANGTGYLFRVSAVNAAGTGSASSAVSANPVAPTTSTTTTAPATTTVPATTSAPFGRTPAVAADDDHRRPALPGRRNPPPALLPGMNRADSWRSGLIRSERG